MKKYYITAGLYSLVSLLTFIAGYKYGTTDVVGFYVFALAVIVIDFFAVISWFSALKELLYESNNGFERICKKSKNSGRDLELLEQIGREDQRDLIHQ